MSHCQHTSHSLPLLVDFPPKDRELAEKAFGRQERAQLKAQRSRADSADEAVDHHRKQLHDLLGPRKLAELREAIAGERLAFRELRQPPDGLERDRGKDAKASRRRINTILGKLDIDREKQRRIQTGFHERLDGILTDTGAKVVPGYHLGRHLAQWRRLSPLHALPLPWGVPPPEDDPSDPHRWFLYRPPFFGFLFRFAPQASDNFRVDRELFLQPASGWVGNRATMDCDDAGSFDYASVTAESQVAVGFVAPATGLVEVLIDAQSTIDAHELEIDDEFGFSEAWCNQNSHLMMNVLHPDVPEPSLALMSNLYRETDGDDLYAHQDNLTRGQHYYAHLYSSGPVAAGQHVVVTAGSRTFDKARADDMELHSTSNCQWFINSVEVRIAP